MRSARSIVLGNNTLTIRTFLFSLRIVSTSTCMHREFLRLLFLQAHLETEAHFTATGMPSHHRHVPFSPRGLPSLPKLERRAAFYQGLVGLAAAKTAALRINLTIDSCGVVAAPSHAPSRTPILLPILLSHQIAFPHLHQCVMVRLVHTSFGSSYRQHTTTCPPLSPSPHANSFVIGTAAINNSPRWTVLCVSCATRGSTVGSATRSAAGVAALASGWWHCRPVWRRRATQEAGKQHVQPAGSAVLGGASGAARGGLRHLSLLCRPPRPGAEGCGGTTEMVHGRARAPPRQT
jgi:hypothetical protein